MVTGGTGFVGSKVAARLLSEGHEVWVTGREGEAGCPRGATMIPWGDAGSEGFDACLHQAANNDTLDGDSWAMMSSNVFEPARLFHSLARNGCRRFVYASSTAVYGNSPAPYREDSRPEPLNIYAKSKLAFDEFAPDFADETGSVVFGLRYCNVYGPGEDHKGRRASMIMHLCSQMISGSRPRIFTGGEQRRDWIYIDDVVDANMACLEADSGGIFNVACGRSVSFNHLVSAINRELGSNLEPEYFECPFKHAYQNNTEADISKAREGLGWSPKISVEEGIRRYLSFLGAAL